MARVPNQPSHIRSPRGSDWFELSWDDGATVRLPNTILRGYCPCAGCQGHGGAIRFLAGRDTEIRDIEPVGNYALRLVFADGHGSGLFSFEYLRRLCELYQEHGDTLPERLPVLP